MIDIREMGAHHPLILDDEVSNIDKIFFLLELRNMDRELHEEEEVILDLPIESEDIIDGTKFLDHRLCMELDNMIECLLFCDIGPHHLDERRDLADLPEKEFDQDVLL